VDRQETTHPLTANRLALISTAIFGSSEQDHRQETISEYSRFRLPLPPTPEFLNGASRSPAGTLLTYTQGVFFKMILIRLPR
jgi:hypothetical protein